MAVPVLLGPLVLLAILAFIGLIIFFIVRVGKDRPGLAALVIGGLLLLLVAGVFNIGVMRMHGGPGRLRMNVVGLPVILIFVGLVIAFIKGGRGVRIGIGVLAGLALLVLPVLGLFAVRVDVARDASRQGHATAVSARGAVEPAIWHDGVIDQYAADVYPSRRSAARALGMRVSAALDEVLPGQRQATRIRFVPDEANPGLAEVLAEGYGSRGGTWTVAPAESSGNGDDVIVEVQAVDLQGAAAPWSETTNTEGGGKSADWAVNNSRLATVGDQIESGTLRASIRLADGTTTSVMAEFMEKPWVENIAAFLGRDPRRQFALGRSTRSCTSPDEARAQALSTACSAVEHILQRTQAQPVMKVEMGVTEADLLYNSAGLIVDRFSQRLSGSMTGPIWREAVLVDVSDAKMQALAERKIAAARQERTTWAKMALTLGGMFALICVVYVFLNAATRGYYAWALRIAVVVLMGAGVFFWLLLSR